MRSFALVTRSAAIGAALVALSTTVPAVAAAQHAAHTEPAAAATKDIVQTAVDAGSFKTLVAAVQAAGLVETLKGKGPFTVFAPSDAAFAKLPKGTVEALLADKEALTRVLTLHVVPGRVMAADIVQAGSVKPRTVNGQSLSIAVRGGKVYVDGAQVVSADVNASNGVIHVVDTVLLPAAASGNE